MMEILKLKKTIEKLLKESTDQKTYQTTNSNLLKEQDKKIVSLTALITDYTTTSNNLSLQLESMKNNLESKVDEIFLNTVSRRRGASLESSVGGTPARNQNSFESGRATNIYS